jgi:hypothetical protein
MPYWDIPNEKLQNLLYDPGAFTALLQEIDTRLIRINEQAAVTNGPHIDMPTDDELRFGLERALNRAYTREHKRHDAARVKELIAKEYEGIAPEVIPYILKSIEEREGLGTEMFTSPMTRAVYEQEPFLTRTEVGPDAPPMYTFDLKRFVEYFRGHTPGVQQGPRDLEKIISDALVQSGEPKPVGTSSQYHKTGKDEINKLLDVVRNVTQEKTLKRVAVYFNLFQEYDIAGSPWILDEGAKTIMRKPLDVEKAVREGGVYEYSIGDKVFIDGDIGPQEVEIINRLPQRKYTVKMNTGLEREASEDELFTWANLI